MAGELNKQLSELEILAKLTGKEWMLVDNNELSLKVTVDTLLGYIAKEINRGTISEGAFTASSNIIRIPVGEDLPLVSRQDGNFYLRECDSHNAQISAGIPTNIRVSPNMGLKIVD